MIGWLFGSVTCIAAAGLLSVGLDVNAPTAIGIGLLCGYVGSVLGILWDNA